MKKAKSLIPKEDEVFIIVFDTSKSLNDMIKFDVVKSKDAKQYDEELLKELGVEDFSSKYFPVILDFEDFQHIIKAGLIPYMRLMAAESGYVESEENKANFEYYYGKGNTEIN
jgi:hypothetical protein